MLDSNWIKCEGVVDSENECDTVACRASDLGIELAYMSCGEIRTVTVQGIFNVCPMAATGYNQEQVIEFLLPGYIAVPVEYQTKNVVITISPDYDVSIIDEEDVIPNDVSVVEIEENAELDQVDEEVRSVLGIM